MINEVHKTDCVAFLKTYSGQPIKLVCTDPPYDLPSWSGGGFFSGGKKREWMEEMNVDNLARSYDISEFAGLVEKAQDGKINAYFFCNKLQIPDYFKEYVEKRRCKFDIITWHKTNSMPTFNGKYLTDTEYILYFRNGGGGGAIRNPTTMQRPTSWEKST